MGLKYVCCYRFMEREKNTATEQRENRDWFDSN